MLYTLSPLSLISTRSLKTGFRIAVDVARWLVVNASRHATLASWGLACWGMTSQQILPAAWAGTIVTGRREEKHQVT